MKTPFLCTFALLLASTVPAWGQAADAAKAKAPATPSKLPAAPAALAAHPPAAAPAAAAPAGAKKVDWDGMNKQQRRAYMKKAVLPAMQKVFTEFDAKKYKKITCETCHGDGVNDAYKMPNPKLPQMPVDSAGFKALGEKKPDAMKFMSTKVKPTMAALLGKPESTQQHPEGFGCFSCHTKEGASPAPVQEK